MEEEAKITKVSLDDIKKEESQQIVDSIMDKILKIK